MTRLVRMWMLWPLPIVLDDSQIELRSCKDRQLENVCVVLFYVTIHTSIRKYFLLSFSLDARDSSRKPTSATCLTKRFHGVMVSTLDFESSNPSSSLGGTFRSIFLNTLFRNEWRKWNSDLRDGVDAWNAKGLVSMLHMVGKLFDFFFGIYSKNRKPTNHHLIAWLVFKKKKTISIPGERSRRIGVTCTDKSFLGHLPLSTTVYIEKKKIEVPPRVELGLLDSESRVLTITPWNLSRLNSSFPAWGKNRRGERIRNFWVFKCLFWRLKRGIYNTTYFLTSKTRWPDSHYVAFQIVSKSFLKNKWNYDFDCFGKVLWKDVMW